MLCYLPDWTNWLIYFAFAAGFFCYRSCLIEHTREEMAREIAESERWNKMTPTEQADEVIYGPFDVRM